MEPGTLYILKSKSTLRYYIGSTNNLKRRLNEHARGKSVYTRITGPYELVFKQDYPGLPMARKMEMKLKKFKSRIILDKIIGDGIIKLGP